jgi:glycosyltransferase involved in cell wall biosynthesis
MSQEKHAPRISLCLIARDEEQMLPGRLASVLGAVDEMVVVDTGSTEGTREIARAAGARVYEQPWRGDFSAPRNKAARRATGDFILQLDADERLASGAAEILRAAVAGADWAAAASTCPPRPRRTRPGRARAVCRGGGPRPRPSGHRSTAGRRSSRLPA